MWSPTDSGEASPPARAAPALEPRIATFTKTPFRRDSIFVTHCTQCFSAAQELSSFHSQKISSEKCHSSNHRNPLFQECSGAPIHVAIKDKLQSAASPKRTYQPTQDWRHHCLRVAPQHTYMKRKTRKSCKKMRRIAAIVRKNESGPDSVIFVETVPKMRKILPSHSFPHTERTGERQRLRKKAELVAKTRSRARREHQKTSAERSMSFNYNKRTLISFKILSSMI